MTEMPDVIAQLSVLTFIITSMLAMGLSLSLTIKQIMYPLRNARVVILALLANFAGTRAGLPDPGGDPPGRRPGHGLDHRGRCRRRALPYL